MAKRTDYTVKEKKPLFGKNNTRYTNDGQVKHDEDGRKLGLSKAQRSYRAGYLSAQKDSAKAYNARELKKAAKAEARAAKKAEKQAKKSGAAWGSSIGQFIGIERELK